VQQRVLLPSLSLKGLVYKMRVVYPSVETIVEYNELALNLLKVKKSDKSALLNRIKLASVIDACRKKKGDIFDKAIVLIAGIIKNHPFASGNRRTAFITTKDFILSNNCSIGVRDDPDHAKVLLGIREGFYSQEEIKKWLQNGKIKEFKR